MRQLKKPEFIFHNQWKDLLYTRPITDILGPLLDINLAVLSISVIEFGLTKDGLVIGLLGFVLEIEWATYWTSTD